MPYERKETYSIPAVLNYLPDLSSVAPRDFKALKELKKTKRDYDGDLIKMASDRYYTFRESLKCASCDLVGVFFAKERHVDKKGNPLSEGYHFNLYAINHKGEEVLMTKDHIIAKANGGKDRLDNYQTMCTCCNLEKADS